MRCVLFSILIVVSNLAYAQDGKVKPVWISTGERKVKMLIPSAWTHATKQGIDSDIGFFITSAGDTLHYDLGRYSNSLNDPQYYDPEVIDYKSNISWTQLGGHKCKVASFTYGTGSEFGIYFPELWTITQEEPHFWKDVIKLTIYGRNISKISQQEVLQALKSLSVSK